MNFLDIALSFSDTLLSNPELNDDQKRYINSLFDKSYNELKQEIETNNKVFNNLVSVLKHIKAFTDGPIGVENYIEIFNEICYQRLDIQIPDYDFSICADCLEKEITTANISECAQIADVLKDIDRVCFRKTRHLLHLRVASICSKFINNFGNQSIKLMSETVIQSLVAIQNSGIEILSWIQEIFYVICDYLSNRYSIIENVANMPGEEQNLILTLRLCAPIINENYQSKFNELNNYIISNNAYFNREYIFANIKRNKVVYTQRRAFAKITIYKEYHESIGKFAVKEYSKIQDDYENVILNELEIMKILSTKASKNNCFVKVFFLHRDDSKISICMEYFKYNLKQYIDYWKSINYSLDDKQLKVLMTKLISCFAELENLKINHRDIKPQNIMITPKLMPKIIDFNVSLHKLTEDFQLSVTNDHLIEGTVDYMAPELIELLFKGEKVGKYRPGRADVFSLGLTLLQLIYQKPVHKLNHKENNEHLMNIVKSLKIDENIKTCLKKMLDVDYKKREKFSKLLKYFDSDDVDPTIDN
ncbi:hypothetical protein SteCoe_33061 [Stentor coeruleus]|uniref:Protein kinase domain-containing protein n=1 Tax=Stentor coeruleus TaxID=5963 RepID=A0A1R2AY06_9CILI|nr:hypothetical protein SteCoe_33061 [Stentor coeruleus]